MKRRPLALISVCALFFFFTLSNVGKTASGPTQRKPGSGPPSYQNQSDPPNQEWQPVIAPQALQQIKALVDEKNSRTEAQQKIDSQLLYAIKTRRGQPLAAGIDKLNLSVAADSAGSVTVDVTAIIDDALLATLARMGVKVSSSFPRYHTLRAEAQLEQLESIASLPQVRFIQPKQEAMYSQTPAEGQNRTYPPRPADDFNKRSTRVSGIIQQAIGSQMSPSSALKIGKVTSQGDRTHAAFSARGTFNVDGTGIKIGVLSDGVTNLATSQATGDLGAVTILPGQGGSGDEGTAMLELIHDLAPGAELFFATAGSGLASFAQNIRDLRSAGCDIILDDIGYFVESPFQDGQAPSIISPTNGGVATQAVNDVVASGALYFSSAANSGNKNDGTSGTWEGDFVDGGPLSTLAGGTVHDFDPGAAVVQYNTITQSGGPLNMHWSDPLGASSNDYDLFVLDSTGTFVVASSTNIQNGTQDPYEQTFGFQTLRVVVLKKTGAANRFLHLATNRGELSFSTDGETHGHNAASGAYGVAAVCAVCVFPAVFDSSLEVETFSSDGPRRIFFNGDGTPITPGNVSSTGGQVLQKPDITAADGTSVSGAGGFPTLFYGTSAAAPHAAAIAALVKSANPGLTPGQIKTALLSTAIDIESPGTDRDSGAGIVMPYLALQTLGSPVSGRAFLDRATVSKTETCCNADGFIEPGESGILNITLNNLGLQDATSATATLTTSTSGVTINNGSSAYPTLAASTGSGANTTPFSLSLSSTLPHNPRADFILTINYLGGHQPSQTFTFSVQFGVELLENSGFEEGDFTGWKVSTASTGGIGTPYIPWSVSEAGTGGFPLYNILPTEPQEGAYDAWHGFDGAGPMEFRMYQDVTIPAGSELNLTWKDRVQWNFCCGATLPRTYDVQIRDPSTNDVLTTVYTFSTGTSPGYRRTPWLTHGVDLSFFAGRTVRIFFLQTIPEFHTGPGQIEFDAISVSNGPLPTPTPAPTPGPATPGLYGGTRNGDLLRIDVATGAGTSVGNLPFSASTEIEFNNNTNRAYSQFPDGSFAGQEFDMSDGEGIGNPVFTGGAFNGLEWVGTSLYGTMITGPRGASQLRILDPETGESTLIGPTSIEDPIAGLAYDEATGVMYGVTGGGLGTPSRLVTVNLTTGVATVIGQVGFNAGSLEFGPDGNLYGGSVGSSLTGGTGNLHRIEKATGTSTLVGPTTFVNLTGLTLVSAPVPTPTPGPTPVPTNTVTIGVGLVSLPESPNSTSKIDIPVTRTGDTTLPASVDYTTSDGSASDRSDYGRAMGTLRFAAGQTFQVITVFIIDDRFGEGAEAFNVQLSNPIGCALGSPGQLIITINSNESVNGLNPVRDASFDSDFFVRQHYLDFFNREPDTDGLVFWKNQIDQCAMQLCREVRRINVSAAFFVSIEFQETGYLVYKTNQAAFNSGEGLKLRSFLPDTQEIGRGVVIGQPAATFILETNKRRFFLDFVQRSAFLSLAAYPNTLTAAQFVDKLNANTYDPQSATPTGSLTSGERESLVAQLAPDPASPILRAQVLRTVVENAEFHSRQFNKAFVLMQYFGYLRRNPNEAPEPGLNFAGYNFWLNKLNSFNGNYIGAEMVKAFITSTEYQRRFGP